MTTAEQCPFEKLILSNVDLLEEIVSYLRPEDILNLQESYSRAYNSPLWRHSSVYRSLGQRWFRGMIFDIRDNPTVEKGRSYLKRMALGTPFLDRDADAGDDYIVCSSYSRERYLPTSCCVTSLAFTPDNVPPGFRDCILFSDLNILRMVGISQFYTRIVFEEGLSSNIDHFAFSPGGHYCVMVSKEDEVMYLDMSHQHDATLTVVRTPWKMDHDLFSNDVFLDDHTLVLQCSNYGLYKKDLREEGGNNYWGVSGELYEPRANLYLSEVGLKTFLLYRNVMPFKYAYRIIPSEDGYHLFHTVPCDAKHHTHKIYWESPAPNNARYATRLIFGNGHVVDFKVTPDRRRLLVMVLTSDDTVECGGPDTSPLANSSLWDENCTMSFDYPRARNAIVYSLNLSSRKIMPIIMHCNLPLSPINGTFAPLRHKTVARYPELQAFDNFLSIRTEDYLHIYLTSVGALNPRAFRVHLNGWCTDVTLSPDLKWIAQTVLVTDGYGTMLNRFDYIPREPWEIERQSSSNPYIFHLTSDVSITRRFL
jgi:hypothetical protein